MGDASSAFLPGLSFDTVQRREEPRPALSEPRTEPSRSQNPDGSSEHDIRLVGLGLSMSRIYKDDMTPVALAPPLAPRGGFRGS